MSILSVDQISPIGSGTTITLNATEVKTGNEITVGTGASIFSPAGNTLTFGTNNVERIRIKNDGKVGINTSNTSNAKLEISDRSTGTFSGLAVGTIYGTSLFGGYNNYPAIMDSNQQPLIYCDTNNDRTELFGDTVGFGTTCAFRVNNAERVRIDTSGNATFNTGNIIIGTADKGIDFSAQTPTSVTGASTTAEILDHYEEGSWTPVFINVDSVSYTTQYGIFTRVGRMVLLHGQISVSSIANNDGSTVAISGLPFTGNSSAETCLFTFGRYTNLLPESKLDQFTNARFGGTYVMLHEGNNADISYAELNSSGTIQFSISYMMN